MLLYLLDGELRGSYGVSEVGASGCVCGKVGDNFIRTGFRVGFCTGRASFPNGDAVIEVVQVFVTVSADYVFFGHR